ncbi:putative sugar kinase [Methanonatronarchaeum thermophilum]|uniref:Beta-ribofuranosylaminobenzene 5'-phosphate synthase n=1 Tax=Methanonatronarchaeum thermophilum TaxID=1927129 RepID=A0A1Y3GCY7_9EURY|nr:hypothetical protein [Methanonatronarchaeum thermophilum]OUJ19321.1 putative sugar kinase [Methanonatronarchaeum thermophilum]
MAIQITTPSRLHFGFLNLNKQKNLGGIGLTIQKPNNKLTIQKTNKTTIKNGNTQIKNKTQQIVHHLDLPGLEVEVESYIPPHKGFGSGTQTTLALLTATKKLYKPKLDIEKVAKELGRLKYSRVGLNAYLHGGFILEMGQKNKTYIEKFPENWQILIAVPKGKGEHGNKETKSIQETLPIKGYSERVSSEIITRMIPAIGKDLHTFGKSLNKVQREMGKAFKEIQGDTYSTPEGQKLVQQLKKYTPAVGQSSWGPAIYAILENDVDEAFETAKKTVDNVFITKPNNKGAKITYPDS